MDILFENRYKVTKAFFKEFYSYWLFTRPSRIVIHILLLAGMVGVSLVLLRLESVSPAGICCYLSLYLVYWVTLIIQYVRGCNIQYKRRLEVSNGEPLEAKILVTEGGIESYNTGNENKIQISYDKIRKVIKTKHYYLLKSKAKLCWALKKDGFITGSLDEFLSFLRNKGFKC